LISVSLLWSSYSGLKRHTSSELLIAHFKGASMVSIREGVRVDHYCWYRDSTSLEYMKAYRELTWSRRVYENRLYEVDFGVRISGGASTCIRLAEGAWLLAGGSFRGLVLTERTNAYLWDDLYSDSLRNIASLPDFILLSGEPAMDRLQIKSWMHQVVFVIDGSSRSWYKERMLAECPRIYLTDRSGAYVKRW
jgi:hypothetical protein